MVPKGLLWHAHPLPPQTFQPEPFDLKFRSGGGRLGAAWLAGQVGGLSDQDSGHLYRGKVQEEAALSDISDCRVRMGHPIRVGGQGQLLEAAPGARVWD